MLNKWLEKWLLFWASVCGVPSAVPVVKERSRGRGKRTFEPTPDELELAQMSESLQAGRWQVLRMFRSSEPSRIITLKSLRNYRETWRLVQRWGENDGQDHFKGWSLWHIYIPWNSSFPKMCLAFEVPPSRLCQHDVPPLLSLLAGLLGSSPHSSSLLHLSQYVSPIWMVLMPFLFNKILLIPFHPFSLLGWIPLMWTLSFLLCTK